MLYDYIRSLYKVLIDIVMMCTRIWSHYIKYIKYVSMCFCSN